MPEEIDHPGVKDYKALYDRLGRTEGSLGILQLSIEKTLKEIYSLKYMVDKAVILKEKELCQKKSITQL